MEIISEIENNQTEITNCIKKHGFASEHSFWYFYNQQTYCIKPYFFRFNNDCGMMSIRHNSGIWEIVSEILAPQEKRLELLKYFLDYVLISKKDKKVFISIPESFMHSTYDMLKQSIKFRVTKPPKICYTPIFDMTKWNENLKGKRWKKLRNIKNKFIKAHNFEILPSKEIDKKKLIDIVDRWKKYRNKVNKNENPQMYINFIKNGFEGTDVARSLVINGEPCSITAGWSIPNSNNYYSAIGLHNYKYGGLGEFSNLDDLEQLKNKKYKYVDFGQSTESLLQFKKKFGPDHIYRNYGLYILKI